MLDINFHTLQELPEITGGHVSDKAAIIYFSKWNVLFVLSYLVYDQQVTVKVEFLAQISIHVYELFKHTSIAL